MARTVNLAKLVLLAQSTHVCFHQRIVVWFRLEEEIWPGWEAMEKIEGPEEYKFSKDFLTGCLALVLIGTILFILIPLLIFVLKLSVLVVIPIGLFAALVIFTAFFGRIINILRKRWWPWISDYRLGIAIWTLRFDAMRHALSAMREKVTPSSHHFLTLFTSSCFPFAGIAQVRF